MAVAVDVAVPVAVAVRVAVAVAVDVAVAVAVRVDVGVAVGVRVAVCVGVAVAVGVGELDGVTMQAPAAFENSFCTVYVCPSPPRILPCWALQISPISPLFGSYQASGGAKLVASPTSPSVIVSAISCEATDV